MPEINLKQLRFTYSDMGLLTENKERIQNFKETRDSRQSYVYYKKLDKDLTREELLINYYVIKHSILLKILKNGGYQRGLASMIYIFFK